MSSAGRERIRKRGSGVQDKREAIIQAAIRLFSEHGFERTTTKMIAGEANVAEGTIYTYFPSKKHILFAFLEHTGLKPLRQTFERTKGMPDKEVVYNFLLDRFNLWKMHAALMKAVFAQALFDKDLAEGFYMRIVRPATELIEGYIAQRINDGAFRDISPTMAARAFMGQFFASAILSGAILWDTEIRFTPEEYASQLSELFLEGIKK
jgi:AcrR family transcriptional regulator